MKYRLLCIIILLGTTFSVFAQESQKKHFSPEITLSFNCANNSNVSGFVTGLYNVFFNQKRCNLITGVEYNVKFRNIILLENDFRGRFHYIGIPVNARVNFGKKVKFFIEAGGFFDPIVIEKRIFAKHEIPANKKTVFIHKPDFGFSGGVGLRIPIKKHEFLIKIDHKLTMRRFFDFSRTADLNGLWRIGVGFKF